ncbi:MAG: response regulator [Thermoanaerobacterales bacterium]|nr:response regulator [Bacillota bacterium]MDI6906280.1 response regulator [Thermoanaerobacterales bacterium]
MANIRTLIVEDDPMVAEVNRQFVQSVAFFTVVGLAATGAEALDSIAELKPDLTLLDIYLPDMDGVAVLHEIRRRLLPTDVILITAAQDVPTIQDVIRHGAIDYIIKPFKFNRLKAALESYAGMHEGLAHHRGLVDQETVDRFARGAAREEAGKESLPKGLHELTLKQIYVYLLRQEKSLSADEVAAGVGLARVTARRYLDYLQRVGKVGLELQYGSVGRPVNRYRVVNASPPLDQKD